MAHQMASSIRSSRRDRVSTMRPMSPVRTMPLAWSGAASPREWGRHRTQIPGASGGSLPDQADSRLAPQPGQPCGRRAQGRFRGLGNRGESPWRRRTWARAPRQHVRPPAGGIRAHGDRSPVDVDRREWISSTVRAEDFRGLRHLAERLGDDFIAELCSTRERGPCRSAIACGRCS